jgi:hypothetical protein
MTPRTGSELDKFDVRPLRDAGLSEPTIIKDPSDPKPDDYE